MSLSRSDPDKTLDRDRVWTVDLIAERVDVPARIGDVVHVLEGDTWWLWRPDGAWIALGVAGPPHTHPISEIVGLQAALDAAAPLQAYVLLTPNALTYTNAPAGGSEVTTTGGTRAQLDLRTAVNVVGQAIFSVIPHATGLARFEYSLDSGGAWATLVDLGTGVYGVNALTISAPVAVPASAKIATCLVRLVVTGNGVVDPVLQKAALQFHS